MTVICAGNGGRLHQGGMVDYVVDYIKEVSEVSVREVRSGQNQEIF